MFGIYILADNASRISYNPRTEWAFEQVVFGAIIVKNLGQIDFDMFASTIDDKLDSYVVWQPEPHALHIDAFILNWNGKNIYLFPPFQFDGQCGSQNTNVQQPNRDNRVPNMAHSTVVSNNPATNSKNYRFTTKICDQSHKPTRKYGHKVKAMCREAFKESIPRERSFIQGSTHYRLIMERFHPEVI